MRRQGHEGLQPAQPLRHPHGGADRRRPADAGGPRSARRLLLAHSRRLASVAFCCISTGEFNFPQEDAAEIAVESVRRFLRERGTGMKVIFDVFKESDHEIYRRLLGCD